ncbi:sulfatase family protein [Cellulomonas sp. NS3]|uniref:sulfatase family protein n=1 Tax=Cellulomonas sp. NS3 TaxID=2973977 RepID=UPI0021626E74|nr:sulfatase [Cellulomonas sp. NS3]
MKIIYVDVDSLRPDHTGAYGYPRDITPNLDAMAQDSVVFESYYCSDSPCLPSRTALTSGQFGITNGVVGHFGLDARYRLDAGHGPAYDRPLLGQILGQNGCLTSSVSSFAERHRAHFFLGNFRESVRSTPEVGDEPADAVTDAAIDWISRHTDTDDWYLHLTYWDPHTDYLQAPEWTDAAAAAGPAPAWPDQDAIDAHAEIYGPRSALDLHYSVRPQTSRVPYNMPEEIRTRADFEKLINGYDGGIHFWDTEFGRLRRAIADLGLADDVAIIVSSDHGESFGELGLYAEHGLASEPVHHLPLIIFWPGITDRQLEHRRNDALLYNIDLAPTILDLLDIDVPSRWQGTSFAPALHGQAIPSRDYLVWGHGAHTYQRAVRTRDHLYIKTLHPGSFRAEWESLYDVTNDPYLTHDLKDTQPQLLDAMRGRLSEWWHHYAGTPGALPDPMQQSLQVGPRLYNDPEDYMAHLRATGRSHLADDLNRRLHPDNAASPVSWHAQNQPHTPEEKERFIAMIEASRSASTDQPAAEKAERAGVPELVDDAEAVAASRE